MEIPTDKQVYHEEMADYWIDDDGILCALSKPGPRTIEMQRNSFLLIDRIAKGKKLCMLNDATMAGSQTKETREYATSQLPDRIKALAIVANSSFGKLVVNTFLMFSGQPIPIKMFTSETEARTWLKQHS